MIPSERAHANRLSDTLEKTSQHFMPNKPQKHDFGNSVDLYYNELQITLKYQKAIHEITTKDPIIQKMKTTNKWTENEKTYTTSQHLENHSLDTKTGPIHEKHFWTTTYKQKEMDERKHLTMVEKQHPKTE